MLTYWARDVEPALRFSPEWAIAALSHRPAAALGLNDRGLLAPGYKADVNIIDHEKLTLHPPAPVFDLPAGGRRLQQRADGYRATLVSGTITYRDGQATDVLPGRLVRSSSYSPLRNAA